MGFIAAFGADRLVAAETLYRWARTSRKHHCARSTHARSECALIYSAPYLRFAALVQSSWIWR
jgi:hypothetical protein